MGTPCQFTDSSSAYSYPYSATFALDIPEFIRRDINSINSSCPSVLIAGSVVTTGGCSSIFIICYTSPILLSRPCILSIPVGIMDANWQSCLHLFLQSILDHSGSIATYTVYRSTLMRFFASLGDTPPDQVKHSDVLAFQQLPSTSPRNRDSQVTAATKNQRRAILSSFYRFASTYELPDGTPLFTGIIPTAGMHSLKPEVSLLSMSEDDLERFFAAIPTTTLKGVRDRALFFLYFLTSRRRSELCFLRWRDIEATTIIDDDGSRHAGHLYRYRGKGASREVRAKELPEAGWQALISYLDRAGRLHSMAPDDF